jgi:hypothetical protein
LVTTKKVLACPEANGIVEILPIFTPAEVGAGGSGVGALPPPPPPPHLIKVMQVRIIKIIFKNLIFYFSKSMKIA